MTLQSCTLGAATFAFAGESILNRTISSLTAFTAALGGEKFVKHFILPELADIHIDLIARGNKYYDGIYTAAKIAAFALINAALFFTGMYAASYVLPVTAFTVKGAFGVSMISTIFSECTSQLFSTKKPRRIDLPEVKIDIQKASQMHFPLEEDKEGYYYTSSQGVRMPLSLDPITLGMDPESTPNLRPVIGDLLTCKITGQFFELTGENKVAKVAFLLTAPQSNPSLQKDGSGYFASFPHGDVRLERDDRDKGKEFQLGDLLWAEDGNSFGIIQGNQVKFVQEKNREIFQETWRALIPERS